MSQCKGIVEEIKKVSKIIDISLNNDAINGIADNTENFILQLLEEFAEACNNNKRKIITVDDLKEAINARKIDFLKPLFD